MKSGVIKMYGTYQGKRVGLENENKRIRNDRTSLLQEVRAFYKR